ncbi:unconventional myosin-XIX [Lepisosteus oculatus]|uniref:unconventional myosin-XIX n=1 Tax=Lepisosteus oculatus TaxID=7918 RepID=UPI00371CB303
MASAKPKQRGSSRRALPDGPEEVGAGAGSRGWEYRPARRPGSQKKTIPSPHPSLDDSLEGDLQNFLIDESQLHTYDDLTKVNPVTTTTVLKCLQARYCARVFYTHAGCTLVALNPFQPIPQLYSPDVMKEYHSAARPQEFKPHIFIVAEQAYRNVQGQVEPVNQSLVVSGESGAGKTWTSRCLMKYYATVAASRSSQKAQDTVERIERRVLDSNPIMEAFGNACTLRNHNSSRFGKYIQLQLNRSQQLVGASVQTYLLEKTRVACQAPGERNFHIFYQMMKGATQEERQEWKMPAAGQFLWLPNADRTLEEDCFEETRAAMLHLGVHKEVQGQIFQVLAALLQLGNVQFSYPPDESQPCELQEQSKDFLQNAACLLRVPAEELLSCLRVRTIRAGRQQHTVMKPCSQTECSMRRDCLAKVIYAHIFDWIVAFINQSICADSSSWCNFIGLLDVYGFECFHQNNLEQLCINYANEKLQQHFVAHYLKAQQEEYAAEGLEWSFISYQDNQSGLDLIEGPPPSVFSLLNEECRLNRPSDAKQFETRLEKALSGKACVSWDKLSDTPHFTVSHYAGQVSYQIEGMVEKNKDLVPPELVLVLRRSQDALLHSLFSENNQEQSDSKGHSKVITVVSKFKGSLESLMRVLHSTTPHYTRCIKPNTDCRPLTFKKEEVITQLEACGIVETINISAAGFPVRIPYPSFVKRYGLITLSKISSVSNGSGSEDERDTLGSAVRHVLRFVTPGQPLDPFDPSEGRLRSTQVHCGKTKVFLTHAMLERLEIERGRALACRAYSIQRCWRRYCHRKRERQRRAATLIQAGVRSWLTRREILKWQTAATVIQRAWRTWRAVMEALADAELDDAVDIEEVTISLPGSPIPVTRPAQFPQGQPVVVQNWPIGLALASFAATSVAVTSSGFQKLVSLMACLQLSFRRIDYKVETNQFDQGVASIRAHPRQSVKFHLQRSPLLYADICPEQKADGISGFNQILLEKT